MYRLFDENKLSSKGKGILLESIIKISNKQALHVLYYASGFRIISCVFLALLKSKDNNKKRKAKTVIYKTSQSRPSRNTITKN
jgi:hypothetical protein